MGSLLNKKARPNQLEVLVEHMNSLFDEIQEYDLPDNLVIKIQELLQNYLKLTEEHSELQNLLKVYQDKENLENFKQCQARMSRRTLIPEQFFQETFEEHPQDTQTLQIVEPSPLPLKSIPPPPAPPLPQTTKPKYKTLYWSKKLENTQNTIFECHYQPSTFILNKFPHTQTTVKTKKPSLPKSLLSYKKEICISKCLKTFQLTPESILEKVLCLDSQVCEDSKLELLYRAVPSNEEVASLKNSKTLNQNEQLALKLGLVPNIWSILSAVSFKTNFSETIEEISTCISNWQCISLQLMQNKPLKSLMGLILATGNAMNQSNPKFGNAKGFGIEILKELNGVKSPLDSSTFVECLVAEMQSKFGDPYVFTPYEYELLQEISNSSYTLLETSYKNLTSTYTNLKVLQVNSEFDQKISAFLKQAKPKLKTQTNNFEEMQATLDKCHKYFLFGKTLDSEGRLELFKVLAAFSRDYTTCCAKAKFSFK